MSEVQGFVGVDPETSKAEYAERLAKFVAYKEVIVMAVPEQCKNCNFAEHLVNNSANAVLKGESDIETAERTTREFFLSRCEDGPRRALTGKVSFADCGAFTTREKKSQQYGETKTR